MRTRLALFAASVLTLAPGCQTAPLPQDPRIAKILSRVSEEAGVFLATAPRMLSQETFEQRALIPPRRFRPRFGPAALETPKPEYRTRTVLSEYGFAGFKDSPNALREFRQPVSVDGRNVATPQKAARALARGLRSDDDALKKRMLERFEHYGLRGAVADFGQVLLLFTRHRLGDYTFSITSQAMIGAETATILSFKQRAGSANLLVFEKGHAIHQPLEGEIWVRRSDSLPLRIRLRSTIQEGATVTRHEATVDYVPTRHGTLAPVSVVHREYAGSTLLAENLCHYSSFRLFSADSELQFNEPAQK
jgi:hypothetical protein